MPTSAASSTTSPTWSTTTRASTTASKSSVNARLGDGGFIFGGITTERTATNNCTDLRVNSNPNNLRFCDQTPPFRTLYKASAAYTFPSTSS